MMLGILSCEVRSAAVRATPFIPGVLAMRSKVGAMRLGDCSPGTLSTRWHSAQIAWAIFNPWAGLPTSCARKLPSVNVKPASATPIADPRQSGDLKMFYSHDSLDSLADTGVVVRALVQRTARGQVVIRRHVIT